MREVEMRDKLEICTKSELIDMIIVSWMGLESIIEQIKNGSEAPDAKG